jgi:homoserine dehydrogenase
LKAVDSSHPFYNLNGSEKYHFVYLEDWNISLIDERGRVPWCGEVAAMGVFADIMSVARLTNEDRKHIRVTLF